MSKIEIFIAVATIAHLIGYVALVYFVTHIKAGGDAKEGEIIDHTWDDDLKEINNPMPGWWLNMFYILIGWGFLYVLFYPGAFYSGVFSKWTQVQQYEQESAEVNSRSEDYFQLYANKSVEELAKMPEALDTGRRIFTQNCAVCHGMDAGGVEGSYPNLTDKDWIWGGKAQDIVKTITDGRTPLMPAGGALIANPHQLSGEDEGNLDAVAGFVASLSGHKVSPAEVEKGQALYAKSCIGCHGPEGKGNPLVGAPNLTDDIWLYTYAGQNTEDLKSFLKGQILNPPNHKMPAWKTVLSPERIKVVSAYVYSLSQTENQ